MGCDHSSRTVLGLAIDTIRDGGMRGIDSFQSLILGDEKASAEFHDQLSQADKETQDQIRHAFPAIFMEL